MNLNPTESRRIVMLDVQTTDADQPQSDPNRSTPTATVIKIHIIVDDGIQITEADFSAATELELLREFWAAVKPDDMFYGYAALDRLALLRRRSWTQHLIPSRGLNLAAVYRHIVVDTSLPSLASDTGHRRAETLVAVLGLTGSTAKAN
jgi:hypothetical protein